METANLRRSAKRVVVAVFGAQPVRLVVRGIIELSRLLLRLYGQARFRALVPSAGPNSVCHWGTTLKCGHNMTIGDHVYIGEFASIGAYSPVVLEDQVRISRGVVIETAGVDFTEEPPYKHIARPITVKKGAWLATNAIILGGVTIGEYAVIGAGAIITHDVEPYTVVAAPSMRQVPFRPKSRLQVVH